MAGSDIAEKPSSGSYTDSRMSGLAYVCPDCKSPLEQLHCRACDHDYQRRGDFPVLLSRKPAYREAAEIGAAYDAIYDSRTNLWEEQGRTEEFLDYFASLLSRFGNGRYLEIGCGEGFLLARVRAQEKFAVDLSVCAMQDASKRVQAHFCVALAEGLPFPDNSIDYGAAVGVMEHFLDDREAFREIWRVIRPGGYFVILVHVHLTIWERIALKISRYVFPRPRPIELIRWLAGYLRGQDGQRDLPLQPVQNQYTTRNGSARMADAGFHIREILHTRRYPDLPLVGPDVVIYVGQK